MSAAPAPSTAAMEAAGSNIGHWTEAGGAMTRRTESKVLIIAHSEGTRHVLTASRELAHPIRTASYDTGTILHAKL